MAQKQENASTSTTIPNDLKAEQALGFIGLGLMQKMMKEGPDKWSWSEAEDGGQADLIALHQRLEMTELAIKTGAPLTTAEVTHLLGAKPGSSKTERGGLLAKRISRNVWKISKADQNIYGRN